MQQDTLTQTLHSNYQRAGRETKYWGFYFLRELKKHGGLNVAKRILAKSGKAAQTKGFLALADAGRPDLSVEAVVLMPEFRHLFTAEELAIAEKRLKRFPSFSWRKTADRAAIYPDELLPHRDYREGAVSRVKVNRYERDPVARAACLAKHGTRCQVCGLRFDERYGDIGEGFIHVHHLKPLATMRKEYQIVPETDLIPVCPNCHAMLHTSEPPLSVDELKAKVRSSVMDKSELQELLAALYLRLNGYFSGGFIAHAPVGNLTEIDVLAVRFPDHKEPEREVEPCMYLHPPNDCVDFIVGEVKGGKKNPKFNAKFHQRPETVEKVLNRIGAFSKTEIADLIPKVIAAAKPETWRTRDDFPVLPIPGSRAQLRLVLFAPDHTREPKHRRPAIYGDDMVNFIWKCLRPTSTRVGCAVDYNRNLWGHQFNALVAYFKEWSRQAPGKVEDVYLAVLGDT